MGDVKVLTGSLARMRGLLFSKRGAGAVALVPCGDVHTFGMKYAIDIAFVGADARVIRSYRSVEPGCRLRCCNAAATIERASAPTEQWYAPGAYAGEEIEKAIRERKPR